MAQAAGRTLEGPDQGAGLFIFVFCSISPTALNFIASSGSQAHRSSLSRDATCKTPLDDDFITRVLLQLAA
jgi:hypothetical protein